MFYRTKFGLIVFPISTGVACVWSLSSKVLSEKVLVELEKLYERAQPSMRQ